MGTDIPDPTLAPHERKVRVPDRTLPELASLEISDFGAWLARNRRAPGDILRIQTLDAYEVESDGGDFAAYVQGASRPELAGPRAVL